MQEPPWIFRANSKNGKIPPALTNEDIELVAGCGVKEIPHLIGTTTEVVDGVVMNFI